MNKTNLLTRSKQITLTAFLVASAGCKGEGVTYVAGPFQIDSGTDSDSAPATESDAGQETYPPCPSGYQCMDIAAGIAAQGLTGTVSDQMGNPIRYACAGATQEPCETPTDPEMSCPALPQAFCAHVVLSVATLDICAQKCSP